MSRNDVSEASGLATLLVWVGHISAVIGILSFLAGVFAFIWPGTARKAANTLLDRVEAIHGTVEQIGEGVERVEENTLTLLDGQARLGQASDDLQDSAGRVEGAVAGLQGSAARVEDGLGQAVEGIDRILVTLNPVGASMTGMMLDIPCKAGGRITGYATVENNSRDWASDVELALLDAAGGALWRGQAGDISPDNMRELQPELTQTPSALCFWNTVEGRRSVHGRYITDWRVFDEDSCKTDEYAESTMYTPIEKRMTEEEAGRLCG